MVSTMNRNQLYGILLLMITTIVLVMATYSSETKAQVDHESFEAKTVEVILQRHYLDGEVSEETVEETIWSMEDFWSFYDDWQLVDQGEDQVVFKQDLNDISPLLKMNGYFGLSDEGTLNIYNGRPDDNEVIQSFFQINTSRLKSHLHDELVEGIPVSSKDQYLQVLKTYEKYAVNDL
ncbi:intercompartmental signaling factor BofC [Bacillus shivajii]|uniref:BofC C-terminal domain-containing protein n=1 Tax=Bacillus shivajii TaxID=1983719 RepID=UPI001CF990F6|nr:BofC C-terminal domain-containing protein [Bacillus shivajii]UCZ54346.1 intercompartmental signaling factor BofC [Bacillus shivajii]